MTKFICFITLIAALISSCAQSQQNRYSTSIEDTIKMVENNLSGDVVIQDSMNTWNIIERMKAKSINGVSIAISTNI